MKKYDETITRFFYGVMMLLVFVYCLIAPKTLQLMVATLFSLVLVCILWMLDELKVI